MEGFIEVFFAIDKTQREWITVSQLKAYVAENNLSADCLKSWQTLFDPQKTGIIRLSTFCRILDLNENDVRNEFTANDLENIHVIETDMEHSLRLQIYNLIVYAVEHAFVDQKDMLRFIKQELDQRFGGLWHVVVVYGRYHSFYTYITGYNFCFQYNDRIFIIYRTPDPFAALS